MTTERERTMYPVTVLIGSDGEYVADVSGWAVVVGSGSTLVAAAELGFNAIGVELDPEYAEIAARRVDHAIENRDPQMTLEGIASCRPPSSCH